MKPEETEVLITYRLEQAQTALDDARYLLDGKRSAQSIINRSYYAMFYAAIALLQKIGKIPSKHAGVISLFDREFVKKGIFPKALSKDFHKAFELRQVSDYSKRGRWFQNDLTTKYKRDRLFVCHDSQDLMHPVPSIMLWAEALME